MSRSPKVVAQELEAGIYKSRNLQGLRAYLRRERGDNCEECGLSSWNEKSLPLEVHHINGDSSDHDLENVKLLCANCHSQTPTYRSKDNGKGRPERLGRAIRLATESVLKTDDP